MEALAQKIHDAYERGKRDGEEDSQPMELPPPEMRIVELQDAWAKGYRESWRIRKGGKYP